MKTLEAINVRRAVSLGWRGLGCSKPKCDDPLPPSLFTGEGIAGPWFVEVGVRRRGWDDRRTL